MERLQAFEEMLKDIQERKSFEESEMARMKAEGNIKSATYKQYFTNKIIYQQMLSLYEEYGLL